MLHSSFFVTYECTIQSDPRAILNSENNATINGGNGYVFDTYLTKSVKNAWQVAEKAKQKGVWIIGTDASWDLRRQPEEFDLQQNDITGFTYRANKSDLKDHGWYKIDEKKQLVGMEFHGDLAESDNKKKDEISEKDDDFLILGFIYLPLTVATSFLSLYSEYPVAASTYLGVDSNVTPLKLSLFFDFMLATCTSRDQFIRNKLGFHIKVSENEKDRSNARKQIYRKLSEYKGRVEILDITNFKYKDFPVTERNYNQLSTHLYKSLPTNPDVERVLRSILSLDSESFISRTLYSLRDQIQTESSEKFLEMIFTASLALSLASDGKGGLRNGPAKNPKFEKLMEGNEKKTYLLEIFDEILNNWIDDPSRMIRAARHLETAAQKCIHEMVDELCDTRTPILLKSDDPSQSSATVTAPVRIDFFGGWLDTPPIFFGMENAAVVNMAIQLDGKNPISCHVVKTNSPNIQLCQDGTSIYIQTDEELLYMHNKPSETGALVCACIVSLGFRSLSSLFQTLQCIGLRIETRSDLPHGSGLGTSSIMACTILKAICALGKVSEENFGIEDQIVHTVLRVEQIMTTGGGWQDQFGAMYGGLKKCYYQKGNGIRYTPIPLSPRVIELLETRLLLVYTGKTRLAKNLLQEVIRNFFTCIETKRRLGEMTEAVEEFSSRIETGGVAVELLEQYDKTKNFMTRCEPPIVASMLEQLKEQNLIEVGWAAGAGGGGFVYLWLTDNTPASSVKKFLESSPRFSAMTCHQITIALVHPVTLQLN
ncbi:hypothetical protein GCK72_005001 [Caenorhabditis remanei]|uniref:Uncharacterized protein n=1 Tax=Caenorhabditis remanei TaxID=31234 RepID=A0A6A5HBB4_CAERE|nr:hypothetical protein GCK72_005001 [Caenorhabditis remanei]KAF1765050.1 hypothetical protein GCK72_005001 [Caenorhabditis remanei]